MFSLAVVAVVLGSIRALPLGSTELAGDVSAWVHHIPRWLSFAAEVASGMYPQATVTGYSAVPGWDPVTGWEARMRKSSSPLLAGRAG